VILRCREGADRKGKNCGGENLEHVVCVVVVMDTCEIILL